MALDFVAGCIGGGAGVLVGHPLDTVKVKLQAQDPRNPLYRGTWDTFNKIRAQEGVRGLYRGVTSPMSGVAFVNAIVFGVYGNVQRFVGTSKDDLSSHFLAGAFAGFLQSFICSPMEMAKTRLQMQQTKVYSSALDVLRKALKKGGIREFYRGLNVTFAREIPAFGTYFLAYEGLMLGRDSTTVNMLMAGGTAGCVSWLSAYPMDVLKTRVQADGIGGKPYRWKGAIHCLRDSIPREGWTFLFRGLNSTLIRAFPVNAVTFVVVEWIFKIAEQVKKAAKEREIAEATSLSASSTKPRKNKSPRQSSFVAIDLGCLHADVSCRQCTPLFANLELLL